MENKLPEELQIEIANKAAAYADQAHANDGDDIHIGYLDGATEWAQWKVRYDELKERYDNILATEDGHESKTENVWQSGFATGHEAGYEKANHAVRNELQKQFIDNDVKWVAENQQLKERCEKMEAALIKIVGMSVGENSLRTAIIEIKNIASAAATFGKEVEKEVKS